MIIETSDNRLFLVVDFATPGLAHVWCGHPVRRLKAGYKVTKHRVAAMVRKAGSKVVDRAPTVIE
jgi:hypothetical protein